MRRISDKWFDLGLLVGLNPTTLHNFKDTYSSNDSRCIHVLSHWLNNGHPDYPTTWEGVYSLVCDIEKSIIARDLKRVLESRNVTLKIGNNA